MCNYNRLFLALVLRETNLFEVVGDRAYNVVVGSGSERIESDVELVVGRVLLQVGHRLHNHVCRFLRSTRIVRYEDLSAFFYKSI